MITVRNLGAVALLFFLPLSGAAQALDPEAAVRAFLSPGGTAAAESSVTWEAAAMEGSDLVVRGAKSTISANGKKTGTNTIAEIRFTDVTETGNGHYAASGAVFTDVNTSGDVGAEINFPEIRLTGVRTRDASNDKLPLPVTYEKVETGNISINVPADNIRITIATARVTMADFMDDLPTSGTLDVTGIDVPLSAFPPGPSSPSALGYEKNLVFDVSARGSARPETSGFALEDLTFSGADIGTLSLSVDMDNYPNFANIAQPDPMEMMAVTLKSITIRYVDNSFAVRVLDLMAQTQGMQRHEYAQQLSAALPFMLMAINNPGFQDQVVAAAESFLANPGTLEIGINPAKPLSAAEIVGLAQTAPQTLPDILNVSVKAK